MKIKLSRLKDATIFITPNFSDGETVRYKLKFTKILFWIFLYTLAIFTFTSLIIGITPLKHLIFHYENEQLRIQAEKTADLEHKVKFLTKELESISSVNKKLKYAFILGNSDSIDTTDAVYDSLKYEPSKNLPYGGNLYFIFTKIIDMIFQERSKLADFFIKPSKGLIINEFHPEDGHFGIDFAVQTGSPIFASQGGLVIFSDFTIDDGHKIIIQHENGYISVYKHCSSIIVEERDLVVQGDLVGFSGNSGKNTTGPHLHFELWKDGKPINPEEFFIK